jgi:hypothetical protein
MSAVVEGSQVPISQLKGLTDWIAVKKVGGPIFILDMLSICALAVQQIKCGPRYQGSTE